MIDLFKRSNSPQAPAASRSICVWGPAGAPGKTTLAVNLASELALEGKRVLLIDLDTYSPSISDHFGLVDQPPGLTAAARLVGQGRFDLEQIERLAVRYEVGVGQLAILTGLSSSSRWPEISAEKIEGMLAVALEQFEFVVVDIASPLESSIRQVGGAIDRNVAARTALARCNLVLAVVAADPIGVKRFLDAHEALSVLASNVQVIVNRLRSSALGVKARQQVDDALVEFTGRSAAAFIPSDFDSCDKALFEMVPLAMMKRSSPARQAIAQFARLNFVPSEARKSRRVAKLG